MLKTYQRLWTSPDRIEEATLAQTERAPHLLIDPNLQVSPFFRSDRLCPQCKLLNLPWDETAPRFFIPFLKRFSLVEDTS